VVARSKVLRGGRVKLPQEVLDATGVEPGDTVTFRATGPRTVEMTVEADLAAEAARESRRTGQTDETGVPAAARVPTATEVFRDLAPLTLEQALEAYRIEGPIDLAALREAWQDEAAKDVIGE
jgi:bifunctional DNA-binding transcriptional regulator/antitoxin component of YhaV-PrlF toxin-antitoxin module